MILSVLSPALSSALLKAIPDLRSREVTGVDELRSVGGITGSYVNHMFCHIYHQI
jgi:hypothetical protein